MRLRNILLVVSNMERSVTFYRDLFGLKVIRDFGGNVILTEGLVLQECNGWEELTGYKVQYGGCDGELYFEESKPEAFQQRLDLHDIQYTVTDSGDTRIIRLCDPDNHIIEVVGRVLD